MVNLKYSVFFCFVFFPGRVIYVTLAILELLALWTRVALNSGYSEAIPFLFYRQGPGGVPEK